MVRFIFTKHSQSTTTAIYFWGSPVTLWITVTCRSFGLSIGRSGQLIRHLFSNPLSEFIGDKNLFCNQTMLTWYFVAQNNRTRGNIIMIRFRFDHKLATEKARLKTDFNSIEQ